MREYNENEYMGEEPELLCYYVKNCYTNAKPCPAEKKSESLDFSCSTTIPYIVMFHN